MTEQNQSSPRKTTPEEQRSESPENQNFLTEMEPIEDRKMSQVIHMYNRNEKSRERVLRENQQQDGPGSFRNEQITTYLMPSETEKLDESVPLGINDSVNISVRQSTTQNIQQKAHSLPLGAQVAPQDRIEETLQQFLNDSQQILLQEGGLVEPIVREVLGQRQSSQESHKSQTKSHIDLVREKEQEQATQYIIKSQLREREFRSMSQGRLSVEGDRMVPNREEANSNQAKPKRFAYSVMKQVAEGEEGTQSQQPVMFKTAAQVLSKNFLLKSLYKSGKLVKRSVAKSGQQKRTLTEEEAPAHSVPTQSSQDYNMDQNHASHQSSKQNPLDIAYNQSMADSVNQLTKPVQEEEDDRPFYTATFQVSSAQEYNDPAFQYIPSQMYNDYRNRVQVCYDVKPEERSKTLRCKEADQYYQWERNPSSQQNRLGGNARSSMQIKHKQYPLTKFPGLHQQEDTRIEVRENRSASHNYHSINQLDKNKVGNDLLPEILGATPASSEINLEKVILNRDPFVCRNPIENAVFKNSPQRRKSVERQPMLKLKKFSDLTQPTQRTDKKVKSGNQYVNSTMKTEAPEEPLTQGSIDTAMSSIMQGQKQSYAMLVKNQSSDKKSYEPNLAKSSSNLARLKARFNKNDPNSQEHLHSERVVDGSGGPKHQSVMFANEPMRGMIQDNSVIMASQQHIGSKEDLLPFKTKEENKRQMLDRQKQLQQSKMNITNQPLVEPDFWQSRHKLYENAASTAVIANSERRKKGPFHFASKSVIDGGSKIDTENIPTTDNENDTIEISMNKPIVPREPSLLKPTVTGNVRHIISKSMMEQRQKGLQQDSHTRSSADFVKDAQLNNLKKTLKKASIIQSTEETLGEDYELSRLDLVPQDSVLKSKIFTITDQSTAALVGQGGKSQISVMGPIGKNSLKNTPRKQKKRQRSQMYAHQAKQFIDHSALRTSLPRLNGLKQHEHNNELARQVMSEVRPNMNGDENKRLNMPKKEAILRAYQHYNNMVVDPESSDAESLSSIEAASVASFTSADANLDMAQIRQERTNAKTEEEAIECTKRIVRHIKAQLVQLAEQLRLKELAEERDRIIDSIDILKIQSEIFNEEKENKKRQLFKHYQCNFAYNRALAQIKSQNQRCQNRVKDDNKTAHLANYMNLLGGQGQDDDMQNIKSYMDRDFKNFGNVCLDKAYNNKFERVEQLAKQDFEKNTNKDVFSRYIANIQQENTDIADAFFNKYQDNHISKVINYQCNQGIADPDKKLLYIYKCKESGDKALPILGKIKEGNLFLMDYQINITNCYAFASIMAKETNILQSLCLHNCGMDDKSTAILLSGAFHQKQFREFTTGQHEIGRETVSILSKLFQRRHFKTLKIVDCKVTATVAEEMMLMFGFKCRLKSLTLVKFPFTDRSFKLFSKYFGEDMMLDELDLSYTVGLRPISWIPFLEQLAWNKKLRSLNLSWCNLIEDQQLALKKAAASACLLQRLKEARYEDNNLPKPTGRVSLRALVHKEQADRLDRSPPKVKLEGGQQSQEGEEQATLKPGFEVQDHDQDILDRDRFEMVVGSPRSEQGDVRHRLVRPKRELTPKFLTEKKVQKKKGNEPKAPKAKKQNMKSNPDLYMSSQGSVDQERIPDVETMSFQAMVATEALYKLLRRNPKLQHMDLTRNNLSQIMIARIALGAKCSKACVSVHFSDNPGVSLALKTYLNGRMKCALEKDALQRKQGEGVPVEQFKNRNIESASTIAFQKLLGQELYGPAVEKAEASSSGETKNLFPSLVNESLRLGQIQAKEYEKNSVHNFPKDPDGMLNRTLVFTRVLGYKKEMPGSGRWKMLTNMDQKCWFCSGHVFSLVFWCPGSIAQSQVNPAYIHPDKIQTALQKYETEQRGKGILPEEQSISEAQERPTYIHGPFTDWLPKKMMKIDQLTKLYKNSEPAHILNLMKDDGAQIPKDCTDQESLPQSLRPYYQQVADEYDKEFKVKWRTKVDQNLVFKNPQLVNFEYFHEEDGFSNMKQDGIDVTTTLEDIGLHVYPCMLPPGKVFYAIKQEPQDGMESEGGVNLPGNVDRTRQEEQVVEKDFQIKVFRSRAENGLGTQSIEEIQQNIGFETASNVMKNNSDFDKGLNETPHANFQESSEKPITQQLENALVPAQSLFLHKSIIPLRSEPVPILQKQLFESFMERKFEFHNSVFAPWIKDNKATLEKCLTCDLSMMRLDKVIKDEKDLPKVAKIIHKNMSIIKDMHLDILGSTDNVPYITWLDVTDFCTKCKFLDNQFRPANLDLLFVLVASYDRTRGGLIRGEFIELLIRVAKSKYFDTGKVKSISDGLQMLLDLCLLPNFKQGQWQETRENVFWNMQVNDMLFANLDGLRRVYKSYHTKIKKWMEPNEIYLIVTDELRRSRLTVKGAKIVYIMSKMTVADQKNDRERYTRLQFVEFLEVICRIALYWEPLAVAPTPKAAEAAAVDVSQGLETISQTVMESEADVFDQPTTYIEKLAIVIEEVLAIRGIPYKEYELKNEVDSDVDISDQDY